MYQIRTNKHLARSVVCLVMAIGLLTQLTAQTAAAFTDPPAQPNGYYPANGMSFFDPTESAACAVAAGNGPAAPSATAAEREKAAYSFLVGNGLTAIQAAAVVGNLLVEAGGELDPTVNQDGGGAGRGIAQWSVNERWAALVKLAGEQKPPADPLSMDWQLKYLWHELITPGLENASLIALKQETEINKATETFMLKFERPSVPHLDRRQAEAIRIKREYGGTTVDPTTVDPTATTGDCGTTGGIGAAEGFTFPQVTTQARLTGNKPAWCYRSQANCHHDYNAADIFAPTGTVVIAAKPGVVTTRRDGTASHLTIQVNGNGEEHYYQHMSDGSIIVKVGQTVTAGQPLGKVGDRADALGTDPHLHFDILPSSFHFRPSCSGAACSGYPFINPQPALITAFNALPKE